MMVRTELPTATIARFLPRRRARRRYRSPRKVSVRDSQATISPRLPASQGLPLPVALAFLGPADCLSIGANFAQDTRCAAVGKTAMSTPISAMISCAERTPDTGDLIQLVHRPGERGDQLL